MILVSGGVLNRFRSPWPKPRDEPSLGGSAIRQCLVWLARAVILSPTNLIYEERKQKGIVPKMG